VCGKEHGTSDLLGVFWEKSIFEERLQQLEQQVPIVLAKLDLLLPAWELDINRHMMLHLTESIRRHGPCWAWSMFGFERLWGRLTKWMTQTSHPEATMVNSWKAFMTCCQAVPNRANELHENSDSAATAGSASAPFHYIPITFDRQTYALHLPSFLEADASTRITMFDAHREGKRFGYGRHKDHHRWRAELHLLYCKFPKLCKACDCEDHSSCTCLDYAQLWDRFLQDYLDGGYSAPTKNQLPDALDDWAQWALQQDDLSENEQVLCYGPQLSLQQYDKATIGEAGFVASCAERAKFARDSVVLRHSDGQYWAGRVRAFLSHAAPGWEDCSVSDEANIAEVEWFAPAVVASAICNEMSSNLNCPVFKREFRDDPTGNLLANGEAGTMQAGFSSSQLSSRQFSCTE